MHELRTAIAERLCTRRQELEEALFVRIHDGVPHRPPAAQPEYLQGLRAAVASAVRYTLEGIELGHTAPATPSEILAQARRAARAGVGLDTVLHRYLAGHTLLADHAMREAADEDLALPALALRDLVTTTAALLDRLLPQVASAYRQEIARLRHTQPASIPSPPPLLSNPNAHCARRCLQYLAAHAGASNSEIAAAIGITHAPQISRLLKQLHGQSLAVYHCAGAGRPNAWQLTPHGQQIALRLTAHTPTPDRFPSLE